MELHEIARRVRANIVASVYEAQSGHPGGSLSAVEILTTLYFKEMRIDPKDPKRADRDRFVLSKGHATPVLYSVLAERGFFETEELKTFRKYGTRLQGHPDMNLCPGVDMSTGSLGQGFSAAVGMAIGQKIDGSDCRTYVLLGDGECQEGIVWEAAMAAAHNKLENLTAFVDHNGLQIDGKNDDVMRVIPIDEKFASFGWHVINVDGHDFDALEKAIAEAKATKEKPTVIVCETVKGKGVSFMEHQSGWHGKAPNEEEKNAAIKELGV